MFLIFLKKHLPENIDANVVGVLKVWNPVYGHGHLIVSNRLSFRILVAYLDSSFQFPIDLLSVN